MSAREADEVKMDGKEEFQSRMTRVREGMRDQGFHTLLVYDSGRHNFLRMNYVAYLTDFISVGPETMLTIPIDDKPVLYLAPVWDIPRARDESWVEDVRPFPEFHGSLAKTAGKVGIIGREGMHLGLHENLVSALGQAPVNAQEILEAIARSKGPFELARMRRAAEVADAGVSALREDAQPGLKEYELAAIVEYRMRSLGAEDNFGMVVANSHNQALHPPTDRIVQPGDIIISEITPCIGGLFVQICRSMVFGEPPSMVREKYAILHEAMGLGMAAAQTGAPASGVAEAINETFIAYGYEEYCRPPFMRVRGHGLGCGSFAPGSVDDKNQTKLAEGMTFIIHPNQYLPETGYLTLGDTVVMGNTQAESLMKSSWELFVQD